MITVRIGPVRVVHMVSMSITVRISVFIAVLIVMGVGARIGMVSVRRAAGGICV